MGKTVSFSGRQAFELRGLLPVDGKPSNRRLVCLIPFPEVHVGRTQPELQPLMVRMIRRGRCHDVLAAWRPVSWSLGSSSTDGPKISGNT